MPTLNTLIEAFLSSREFDQATVSRVDFWSSALGHHEISEITPDQVDDALRQLAERGRLSPRKHASHQKTGKPLSGATLNRYASQLGSLFKYARRLRLLPRNHISPLIGIEKMPERVDPERYFRPEEVERLIKVTRLVDIRWGRMEAMILLAYHTGLRIGNIKAITWANIDFEARTVTIPRTKNGEPMVSVLSEEASRALKKLTGKHPGRLVFEGKGGRPFNFRRLWNRITEEAGLGGKNFHQLRHGCGHKLATSGVSQALIMAVMGHKTLTASQRYMHHNTSDKAAVIQRVFDHV